MENAVCDCGKQSLTLDTFARSDCGLVLVRTSCAQDAESRRAVRDRTKA